MKVKHIRKKYMICVVIVLLLLAGCVGNKEASKSEEDLKQENVTDTKKSNGKEATVLDIKKKYGEESKQSIMPMYNVEKNKEFTFEFKADMSELNSTEIISVHTDSKVLPESDIQADVSAFLMYDPDKQVTPITVEPSYFAPLQVIGSQSDEATWGNAPMYYIRVNYDLNTPEPVKLKEPMIIPFTIKTGVATPNLKASIGSDGRLSLKWSEVEGAEQYNIYQANPMGIGIFEEGNKPLNGADQGYQGVSVSLLGSVKETEFNDFMTDGSGGLIQVADTITEQNFGVNGEYFVTAVVDGKESSFSAPVDTSALSNQLPTEIAKENNFLFSTFEDVNALPKTVPVSYLNNTTQDKIVNYHTDKVDISEGGTLIPYTIEGTVLKGAFTVKSATKESIKTLVKNEESSEASGYVMPKNESDYVPTPDVPTIIDEENEKAQEEESIEKQKQNTEDQVKEADKEVVQPSDLIINADSALEEYLAINMLEGKEKISIQAFPEAQNVEALSDAILKVIYQNPLIIGAESFQYDYATLSVIVTYQDSQAEMKQKQQKVMDEANKIVKSIIKEDMDANEKQKAIYDYLNDNTTYDNEALENAEKNNFEKTDPSFNDSFSVYGIMVNKVGVCMSYAYTFQLLSELAGLDSIVVTGDLAGVPHAWNKVKLDDQWVHVDTTNNKTNTGIPYFLYNSNDENANRQEFVLDNEYWIDQELSEFESTSYKYDYYVVNDLIVDTMDEYKKLVTKQLQEGKDTIVIRFANKIENQDELYTQTANAYQDTAPEKLETAEFYQLGTYVVIQN
ncbi:transglutaminase domain-containing protein [Aquibacillus kalidii]|uniref:transglutaminase domain-containing protein n=1 Tax=Aquibacillus kalidii TaxID=2762597 RepID=UPI0016477A16|nr:transglutaminase-like domain-containing protein [Aquibacillus kalidii]